MEIDKTTLADLSIFHADDEQSLFHKLDFTRTVQGRERLMRMFNQPLKTYDDIVHTQQAIQFIGSIIPQWPTSISNGSLMVIEKFYVSSIDLIPENPSSLSVYTYKLWSTNDYSLVKFSAIHLIDFIKGMMQFESLFAAQDVPVLIQSIHERLQKLLAHSELKGIEKQTNTAQISQAKQIGLAHFFRYRFKQQMMELMGIYAHLDAWYSMALAADRHNLSYPQLTNSVEPEMQIEGLYHSLLDKAVSYNISLSDHQNFLFLTGANMAGKSTFIKAVGIAVFLAHIGMAVPARSMRISVLDGLLSNINVSDNVVKGQSYFFNEVRRIKDTVLKISDGRKWLILIDELFKGTNVQDAMRCSTEVIHGLLKMQQSLFIVSTHLYEIGNELRQYPNILFRYFETAASKGELEFSYQLKEGISNDRLGYLILQKEGVVDLLKNL